MLVTLSIASHCIHINPFLVINFLGVQMGSAFFSSLGISYWTHPLDLTTVWVYSGMTTYISNVKTTLNWGEKILIFVWNFESNWPSEVRSSWFSDVVKIGNEFILKVTCTLEDTKNDSYRVLWLKPCISFQLQLMFVPFEVEYCPHWLHRSSDSQVSSVK